MDSVKIKPAVSVNETEDSTGKAIRISLEHRALLDRGRKEINSDSTYSKKISYTRYVEKLIEVYWEKPIEELKKEREGSEEYLKIRHKKEAPGTNFFDWMRSEMEGKYKKPSRVKIGGEKV